MARCNCNAPAFVDPESVLVYATTVCSVCAAEQSLCRHDTYSIIIDLYERIQVLEKQVNPFKGIGL